MNISTLKTATAAAALLSFTGVAAAQVTATATTDLNIRSGPGPEHSVIGVIGDSEQASIHGCLEGSQWCQVSYDGVEGWAYSDYLTGNLAGQEEVFISQRPPEADIPTVTYETTASTDDNSGALAGGTTGAIAGAIIGGPAGAAVGGAAGAVAGGAIDTVTPPQEVVTYVEQNTGEPVYLEGEVVVGAALPETVDIREIPDYDYRYAYVNGQPVLVEPGDRRIVYVMRQ
ncbi:DUF1236 domain-containing protein [Chelativorans sp. YIM 93263]|uniref:DUF1236 domain-containing protein n=1 Tax=Chelativorans sp. YIM 93263 TaxID=2906648 RepID=UPI002378685A|nr:DUF1236 domain-containing protein [Chelativorans sp. YIM 93263]